MKNAIFAAIATGTIAAGSFLPTQAQASNGPAPRSIIVDFSDLDLSDENHKVTLRGRVDRAVRRVCPARIEIGVRMLTDHRTCRAKTWESIEPELAKIESNTSRRLAVIAPSSIEG